MGTYPKSKLAQGRIKSKPGRTWCSVIV